MSKIKDFLMSVSDEAYTALQAEAPADLARFGEDPQGFLYEAIADGFQEAHALLVSIYEDLTTTGGGQPNAPMIAAVINRMEKINPKLTKK